ncbi:hypothetical protein [Catenovulum agarivorans]|uniref:hypothetical protein n=1 Tax=Catenovulum agarivorans TaxID=1172192 RepID=UPI000315C4B6|nr:hypothetical protein [Catenovulum agarivorans]
MFLIIGKGHFYAAFELSGISNNAVKGMQKAWPNFCGAKMLANFIPPFTTALEIAKS